MVDFEFLKKFFENYNDVNKGACDDTIKDWKETYREKIIKINELKDYVSDDSPIKFLHSRSQSFVPLGSIRPTMLMIRVADAASNRSPAAKENPQTNATDLEKANYIVSKKYAVDIPKEVSKKDVNKKEVEIPYKDANIHFKNKILPLLQLIISVFTKNELNEDLLYGSLKDALFDDLKAILKDNFNENVVKVLNEKVLDKKPFDANDFTAISTAVGDIRSKKAKMEKITKRLEQYGSDLKQYESALVGINALDLIQKTKLYRDFSARQLFHKMMVIESALDTCDEELKYKLPIVTDSTTIDRLYNDFSDSPQEADKLTAVRKAYEIMKKCYVGLGLKPNLDNLIKISTMLYDYAEGNLGVTEDSPNVIFYGSPGTGKTHTVNKGIDMIMKGHEDGRVARVQCHPGFGYEEFIEGLKPVGFTENGTINLEIVNGKFKDLCIRAKNDPNPNNDYYFVADEINRANLSAMFGETLSLLETDYRDYRDGKRHTISTPMSKMIEAYINSNIEKWIPKDTATVKEKNDAIIKQIKKIAYECNLVYEGDENKIDENKIDEKRSLNAKKEDLPQEKRITGVKDVSFGVPKNIRFIGMMNDVDKSIDAFDLALRRRFKWIRTDCNYDVLVRVLINYGVDDESVSQYCTACENLNNYISRNDKGGLGFGKSYEFGHAYFMKIKTYLKRDKTITEDDRKLLFKEHLLPVLTEYIRSFKDESEIGKYIKEARKVFTAKDEANQDTTDSLAESVTSETIDEADE